MYIPDKVRQIVKQFVESNTDKCLPYPILNRDGYGDIHVKIDGKYRHFKVHRVVFMLFNNCDLSANDIVMHSCDNPACCNPRHLSKGTHADNIQDKVNKGRQAKGINNGRYKHGHYAQYDHHDKPILPFISYSGRSLDIDDVRNVKKLINTDVKVRQISKMLGIKLHVVKDIYYKRTYKNILPAEIDLNPSKTRWQNPGINASKANFECLTIHDAFMEEKSERNKILI